jgi:hypothetical protein
VTVDREGLGAMYATPVPARWRGALTAAGLGGYGGDPVTMTTADLPG